ncbi:MAG: hypothetical protein ABIK65_16030 [Candidatus Eisenbacteria bacterium]
MIGRRRYRNPEESDRYVEWIERGMVPGGEEILGEGEFARERILLGLRRVAGLDLRREGERVGMDLARALDIPLRGLAGAGLLTRRGRRILLTEKGIPLADAVTARLFDGIGASLDKPRSAP